MRRRVWGRSSASVDDDTAFRELVATLVARLGVETVGVARGEDALAALAGELPALAMVDVRLPGISGYEVCRYVSRRANGARSAPAGGAPNADLTPRELEVLELLASGLGQQEIAKELVISPKTVGTHLQRILGKLGVHSRAQAVAIALQHGVVRLGS